MTSTAVDGAADSATLLNAQPALAFVSLALQTPLEGQVALVIGRRMPHPIRVALRELGARPHLATSESAALDVASSAAPPLILVELQGDHGRTVRMGKAVADRSPGSKFVLLDGGDDLRAAAAAARAGFHGYVVSDASPERAIVAIRAAMEDHFMIPRRLAQFAFDTSSPEQERAQAMAEDLTAREWQVLAQLTEGDSNREIGARLGISPHTVRAHIGKILAKLDARDRLEAATFAMRYELIQMPKRRQDEGVSFA